MPVITLASSKGGVGKSTCALLLALELARAGNRVALIDGDRNRPLVKWASIDGKPGNIDVIADTSEETIMATIERCAAEYPFVIVDLEGSANAMILYAVSRSDLVIVPMQASTIDAHEATRTLELVRRIGVTTRQDVRAVLLLTKVPMIGATKEGRAVEAELIAAGYRFLSAQVHERVAYRALFSFGGDLRSLPERSVGNLGNAIVDAAAFAAAVVAELNPLNHYRFWIEGQSPVTLIEVETPRSPSVEKESA